MKELFVFWQFNGSNDCYCQLHCPECYGRDTRTYLHYWNGKVDNWEKAFAKVDAQHGNGGLYFVFSYGEALVSKGFYECVEMIGGHPTWTLNIITNLMADPSRLLQSRLAQEKRLFIMACWHPEGVDDPVRDWEVFKKHLLMLKAVGVSVHVMMVWFDPVIRDFPYYFKWLDRNDFRVGVRRFVNDSFVKKVFLRIPKLHGFYNDSYVLKKYSDVEKGYIYAYTCPKVTEYGLKLASPKGKRCYAGKDMILVKYDGTVKLCASLEDDNRSTIGNIFHPNFKLNELPIRCPTRNCGGDFGCLVLSDERFGKLPESMWRDTFISQVENIRKGSPVPYPNRVEMLKWVEELEQCHV